MAVVVGAGWSTLPSFTVRGYEQYLGGQVDSLLRSEPVRCNRKLSVAHAEQASNRIIAPSEVESRHLKALTGPHAVALQVAKYC